MATILVLVFFKKEDITAVPLLPQPIMPILIAEFALVPKTRDGFKMVAAEIAPVAFKNALLCMGIANVLLNDV
jgi:hypothetical protein